MSTGLTAKIEGAIDRNVAGSITTSTAAGGMSFASMVEVMEFAKVMSIGGVAVPNFLRNNPGACLAVCIQAIEWRMSPFAVANKSYSVNDRLAYESQLVHAVVEQRAPLVGRLRHSFAGEGGKRTCTVWATLKGESEPCSYTSPEFDKITPKNSPLWKTKPDLQLYYNASRDWARMYVPDVILGVYSEDEMPQREATAPPRRLADLMQKPVVVVEQVEDEPRDTLADYRDQLSRATTEQECRDLYERCGNPEVSGWSSEQDQQARDAMGERIAAVKGGAK
jgi:hypothetical protein